MTNKRVQFRRGTTAEHSTFTGAAGEVTVDTTNASLRVHNGSTAGGIEAARADLTNISSSGGAINVQGRKITGLGTPTANTDAVTKQYADSLASGGSLDNLTDVTIESPSGGDVMIYDGAVWVNSALSGDVTVNGSGVTAISADAVTTTELADDAVTTDKILDGAVTNVKLANSAITVGGLSVALGDSVNFVGTANEVSVARVASTFTFGLPDNVTLGGTLTIGGNLVVNGTTTTVNTAELTIEDNVITLNSTQTGTPSNTLTSGIEIERGDSANVSLLWSEGSDKWTVTEDGTNHHNVLHAGMSGVVSSTLIASGAVSASKIASKTITAAQIADGIVSSTLIASGAVTASKIASKTITAAEIADGIVSSTLIASSAVIAAKIADGAVGPAKTDFVESTGFSATSGNLLVANGTKFKSVPVSGAVTANSLGAFSLASLSVTSGILDDSAVTTNKIAPAAVTNDKLLNSGVEFKDATTASTISLGQSVSFVGSSDVSVSLTGSTFTWSLAPTLSVKAGSLANFDTDDLAEGTTNKYFTDAGVINALSGTADQITLSGGGTFSLAPDISGIDTVTANTFSGALVGNADTASTADALASAVTISISGGIVTAPAISFTAGGEYILAATIADGAIPIAKLASSSIELHDAVSSETISLGEQVYFVGTAGEVDVSLSGATFTFSLPSNVSATTFTGDLAGNADTASTADALASAVTISISGGIVTASPISFTAGGAYILAATIADGAIPVAKLASGSIALHDATSNVSVALGGQAFFKGTANEVDVSLSGVTFTFGLPSNVSATTFTGALVGNADTATALAASQVINLGGNLSGSVSFDGTSAVTLTATIVGGGAIGFGTDTTSSTISLGGQVYFKGTANEVEVSLSGSTFTFGLPGTINADLTGTATSADALSSAVTLSLGGDLSGTVSFDEGGTYTLTATIENSSVGNSQLVNSSLTLSDASGSLTASLGDQVYFKGTAGEVEVALSGSTFTFGLPSSLSANTFSGAIAASSLKISGTSVTASAEEINVLDGASSTNDTANKAVLLDGNKDLVLTGGGIRVDTDAAETIFSVTRTGATTSVQTANLTVEDSLVTLNDSAAASRDVGLIGKITSSTFAAFAYDRSASVWKVSANVTAPTDNVITFPASISDLAGLQAGAVDVATLTVGTLDYPSAPGTNGQVLQMTGGTLSFGSVSVSRPNVIVQDDMTTLTLTAHASGQTNVFLTGNGGGGVTLPSLASAGVGYQVYVRAAIDSGTGTVGVLPAAGDTVVPKNNPNPLPSGFTLFDTQVIRLVSGAAAWYEI